MQNKKGQEMSVSTIVIIVISVLVLVFLIIGFSIGWNKIFPFINPPSNVKDVVQKCSLACIQGSKYEFCSTQNEVKTETEVIPGLGEKFKATCYEIVTLVPALGAEPCPAITPTCPAPESVIFSSQVLAQKACNDIAALKGKKVNYDGGLIDCPAAPPAAP